MRPRSLAVALALAALTGCRLIDVVDHQERTVICRNGAADGTPCVGNGDVADRGAGVEYFEGVCASRRCVGLGRGSELAAAEGGAGERRLAIDVGAAVGIGAMVLVLARWLSRRKPAAARLAYELPPDSKDAPAPTAPPRPHRREALAAFALALAVLPGAALLARYPRRMILSARTPRAPEGSGFHADNKCHGAEAVEGDGKTFLVTNVTGVGDALGSLKFLVAYDLASGEPHVLAGPSREYDHAFPVLFARAGDQLVTADRDGAVRILEAGSFQQRGGLTLKRAPRWIQAEPGGGPEVWLGENKYEGYIDLNHPALDQRRAQGWQVSSLECWSRASRLCPEGTPQPEGTKWGRRALFAEGCLSSGERGAEALVVERRARVAPFALVWRIEHERASDASEEITVAGEHFYEVEREGGRAVLVQRALADGGKRWSVPLEHRLALEPPFRRGPWLVVPTYPLKDRYETRYEIRDPASGARVRAVP